MFCNKCGRENLDNASFCTGCGERLQAKVDIQPTNQVEQPESPKINLGKEESVSSANVQLPAYQESQIVAQNNSESQQLQQPIITVANNNSPKPKGGGKLIPVVLSLVGLVIIAVAVYFILQSDSTSARAEERKLPYDPGRAKNEELILAQEYAFANIDLLPIEDTLFEEFLTKASTKSYASDATVKMAINSSYFPYSSILDKISLEIAQQVDPVKENISADLEIKYAGKTLTSANFALVDKVFGMFCEDLYSKRIVMDTRDYPELMKRINPNYDAPDTFAVNDEAKALIKKIDFKKYESIIKKYRQIIIDEINPEDVKLVQDLTYPNNPEITGREISYTANADKMIKILTKVIEKLKEDDQLYDMLYADISEIVTFANKYYRANIPLPEKETFKSSIKPALTILESQLKSANISIETNLIMNSFIDDEGNVISNSLILEVPSSGGMFGINVTNEPTAEGRSHGISVNFADGYGNYNTGFVKSDIKYSPENPTEKEIELILDASDFAPDTETSQISLSIKNTKDSAVLTGGLTAVPDYGQPVIMDIKVAIDKKSDNTYDTEFDVTLDNSDTNIKFMIDAVTDFGKSISFPNLKSSDNLDIGKFSQEELMPVFTEIGNNFYSFAFRLQSIIAGY